jgi:hypothetical protein
MLNKDSLSPSGSSPVSVTETYCSVAKVTCWSNATGGLSSPYADAGTVSENTIATAVAQHIDKATNSRLDRPTENGFSSISRSSTG